MKVLRLFGRYPEETQAEVGHYLGEMYGVRWRRQVEDEIASRRVAEEATILAGASEVQVGSLDGSSGANAPVHEPTAPVQMNRNEPVFDGAKGGLEGGFLQFWIEYPKKTGKQEALRIWKKLKPNQKLQDQILRAIREQKTTDDWLKDAGQFIPHPKTWLNQGRWDDEPMVQTGSNRRQVNAKWQDKTEAREVKL